jgi:hypothetical protein
MSNFLEGLVLSFLNITNGWVNGAAQRLLKRNINGPWEGWVHIGKK